MIGWDAVECLLEWASLPDWESRSLLVMIRDFWQRLQRDAASEVTLVLDSTSVALVQGLASVALWGGMQHKLQTLFRCCWLSH